MILIRWVTDSRFNRLLAVGMLTAGFLCVGCQSSSTLDESELTLRKQIAGELRDNKLYQAAIDEYESLLGHADLNNSDRANLNYLIARIYYEDIKEYRSAAAYYLRARAYDPDGSFMAEASRNLVASLQKIGNLVDAKRELGSATDIDYVPSEPGDKAVASIDGAPIYRSQIEKEIAALPQELQRQLLTPESKIEYVRQYVGVELIYKAAVRENYHSDPEIVRRQEKLAKRLVVDKYIVDKVMPEITVDTVDVRNFFLAHQEDMYKGQVYDSVRAQVFLDYQQVKAEAAYADYINRLARTENVEFLDQNWQ